MKDAMNQYHCPECDGTGGDWYGHKAGCSIQIARYQKMANSFSRYAAFCRDSVLDQSFRADAGLYLPKWGKL